MKTFKNFLRGGKYGNFLCYTESIFHGDGGTTT